MYVFLIMEFFNLIVAASLNIKSDQVWHFALLVGEVEERAHVFICIVELLENWHILTV